MSRARGFTLIEFLVVIAMISLLVGLILPALSGSQRQARSMKDSALEGGVGPGDPAYDRSPTLLLHGPRRQWVGNICFSDNHMEILENFYPQLTTYERAGGSLGPQKDNIFAAEFDSPRGKEAAADAWLAVALTNDGDQVDETFDELLP